jgi:hypothetical protein
MPMPISVQCDCGRSLRVKDELAGRKVKCPQCDGVLLVPQPEPAAEEPGYGLLTADAPEEEARPRRKAKSDADEGVQTAPRSRRSAADEDEEDPEDSRRERRKREEEDREEERLRERRSRDVHREVKRARRADRAERLRHTPFSGYAGRNMGVVGGVICILIAFGWFGCGLMFGIIFFYPLVLVVIGIAAIIRGLAGR